MLIDGKCHEGCNQVVVGSSVKVKCRIGDQTIIDTVTPKTLSILTPNAV